MAGFELAGPVTATSDLPIRPRRAAPANAAFDARSSPESLWRVDLVRDLAASSALLDDGEHSLTRTRAALDDATRRLDRSLAQLEHARQPRSAARGSPTGPERDLGESNLIA